MMRAVILFAMLGWVGSLTWSAIEGLGIEAAFIVAVSIMVAATIIGIVVPSYRRFERVATERFPITADPSRSG